MTAVPMEDDAGAAIARRRIGRILTELRERSRRSGDKQLTLEEAARAVELARPTMWRIENGRDGVQLKNLYINALCDLYGAPEDIREELLVLAVTSRRRGWFHPYSDVLAPNFDVYVGLEAAARDITAYESDRVHGLMQTDDYAREMLRIPGPGGKTRDADEIDRRLQVRLRRQAILTRTTPAPVRLDWILGEAVLRRRAGSPTVTARQLDRINELGELDHICIQVVPFDAGLHQGIVSGPFARLRFDDDYEPPTVYADGFMGNLLINKPEQVNRYNGVITAMRSVALDAQKSRDVIHRTAKEHLRA